MINQVIKILIVVTSHGQLGDTGKATGYYLPEVSHPYEKLKALGFEVDIASPKGGKAPMDESSRDKKLLENKEFVAKLENTFALKDVKAKDYQAILYAGGHGTMWDFSNSPEINNLSKSIYEAGGVVAAVCHGPAALINIKLSDGSYLVAGKSVTGFSNAEEEASKLTKVMPFLLEDDLKKRGAKFSAKPLWQANVVTDGRLVTGQNPASALGVGEAVAKLLKRQE